jgi:hypothetical protein
MKKVWCFSPQHGGNKISDKQRLAVCDQITAFAQTRPWYPRFCIRPRFKSQFCYLDAVEGSGNPFPIGRLRYFAPKQWSLAFYTYSNERYEPCLFPSGEWMGTIEEAIIVCEMYLN